MSGTNYLPSLLKKTAQLVDDSRFFLSSIPNVDPNVGDGLIRRLEGARKIYSGNQDFTLLTKEEFMDCVQTIDEVLVPLKIFLTSPDVQNPQPQPSQTVRLGGRGRPRYQINLDRAKELHDMGNSWESVADAMGVSRKTMYNHLVEAGMTRERIPYSEMGDEDLDRLVADISSYHPMAGSIIMQGHLRAKGHNVEINRIRESLRRVDEEGVALRWRETTSRRVYRVRGSNALWHQDGNEKLKPWGFYIHGCVDGYSRMSIYLVCTNNKRSKTVGDCFAKAVKEFGWPSRVRGDYGTENNEIERMMVRRWGVAHHPYLRGRSTHNVRIERFWRDVRRDSLDFFRETFMILEKTHLFSADSPIHLVCLYLVYQPRIQQSLDETRRSWNNHSLRTEGYQSPKALYELSKERAINAGYWNSDLVGDPQSEVDEDYGVEDGLVPPRDEEDPIAPRSDEFADVEEEKEAGILITEDDFISHARNVLEGMDFEADDGVYGMDVYCEAVIRLTAYYDSLSDSEDTSSSSEDGTSTSTSSSSGNDCRDSDDEAGDQ